MNETQKSLIIVGLVLMLLGLAQHGLFVQRLDTRLQTEQAEYELQEYSEENITNAANDSLAQKDEMRILELERKLKRASIFKYLIGFGGVAFFVSAWFFRNKKAENELEDEWVDDDWEDDV